MRFCIFLVFLLNLALSKDVRYKIKNSNQQSGNFISVSGDASSHDSNFQDSLVNMKPKGILAPSIRKCKNCWIPTSHWIGGFLWSYIMRANRENFLYDISHIQNNEIQCTEYQQGDYYDWHTDQDIRTIFSSDQEVRKLSFSLQLSNEDDYTGGDLEFTDVDKKKFTAPKNRGCRIVVDSRTIHRVTNIESGIRKSLVGWVLCQRWK